MINCRDMTVREARALFFDVNGLPPNGGYSARWWTFRFGMLTIYLWNFRWRKAAISHHDLHHIVAGYECTLAGEVEIAAWEFAAGRFPHFGATLFCLPLVFAGAIFLPRRTFVAFVRGRRSRSLYAVSIDDRLLDTHVSAIRRRVLPPHATMAVSACDRAAYAALIARAGLASLFIPTVGTWLLS